MSEPVHGPAFHESIFARLVAIMVAMAAFLLVMVAGFYFLIVMPGVHRSVDRLVGQYARAIAATSPDSASARRLAVSLEMPVRYEGPAGSWATEDSMPTLEALGRISRGHGHVLLPSRAYYVVRAPQGGHYVFARSFGQRMQVAHSKMLIMLLVLMAGVFLTAYVVLRRALRPLRLLNEGVARLSEGQLDVAVPSTSRDEFGLLTDAFNRMARRVKDMVQARDQLLLDVSHELRSPLTRMKVALALLPEGGNRSGMEADIDEMERMVAELLELERLRGGHGVRLRRQDISPLLRELFERFQGRPPGVRLREGQPLPPLDLDADRVRIVLGNVLENAIKYSLPDSRPVEISAVERSDRVEVRISDDGPGISAGDAAGLFEPFYRVDRSRSKKTGGYGLGLSICKRIMEAHGGSIALERRDGRGAAFVLTFPRQL